ncbi:hypothetical protein ZIOFF_010518 [Zingiber officinale]|uniref:Uncharacterized protein n=1 Tax=Zingiber officinale TaxID=94328 RepID=A0A8J5LZL7_ZINOF|nr:hypothetical protein ZIOFF_010518 [Zingiber officinale]
MAVALSSLSMRSTSSPSPSKTPSSPPSKMVPSFSLDPCHNLVTARHMILLDLWWNPTIEEQAIDRVHQIGQTHPVKVPRITIKDIVEDRILALQVCCLHIACFWNP